MLWSQECRHIIPFGNPGRDQEEQALGLGDGSVQYGGEIRVAKYDAEPRTPEKGT